MKRLTIVCLLAILAIGVSVLPFVYSAYPYGAAVTPSGNETAPSDTAGSHAAIAGNVTGLTMTAFSTTQSWQGYFGNVTGTIQLADADDDVMYNWSLAAPEGEVYASRYDNITWTNIQCFNFTATGTFADDSGQRGNTSYYGKNLSQLEDEFNIAWDDVDGVNETFDLDGSLPGNSGEHDLFYTNNLEFEQGECLSMNVFSNATAGEDDKFEEVLLYDPNNAIEVFASILEEANVNGFDNVDHDFEMLVLEDGHGTDTDVTVYYFYVELE